ncbi:MAG: Crp/Fnr family transcriptional regulator [Verrucomicrobiae bacterium]|nr:Crp/Fnr family transcriptional regulator [Verrucomicrobiae bacterium]MDW8309650.1 Crp/Fnr family transcriptional regulator [Verrucomicrobiales bacterium]
MTSLDVLGRFDLFRAADRGWAAEIAASATLVRLRAGALLQRQGVECDQFALLSSGRLRVYRISENGREITLYHVREGEPCLVNMLSVFLREPAAANAQAETPVEAVVFPGAMARAWVQTREAFRHFAFATMGRRLLDVMGLVEEIAFRKMDQRLSDWLREAFATRRVLDATHEQIAAELGTAREVVSRLLKTLERHGAIRLTRGHILLRDKTRLGRQTRGSVTKSRKSPRQV